jgi:hypothetical protein
VASGFDFVRVISGDKFNFGTPVTAVESAGAATKFLVPEPLTNRGTDLIALLDKYFNANAKTGVAAALFETTASLKDYLVVDLNGDQHITAADQVVQLSGSISSIQLNTNGHVIIG